MLDSQDTLLQWNEMYMYLLNAHACIYLRNSRSGNDTYAAVALVLHAIR